MVTLDFKTTTFTGGYVSCVRSITGRTLFVLYGLMNRSLNTLENTYMVRNHDLQFRVNQNTKRTTRLTSEPLSKYLYVAKELNAARIAIQAQTVSSFGVSHSKAASWLCIYWNARA